MLNTTVPIWTPKLSNIDTWMVDHFENSLCHWQEFGHWRCLEETGQCFESVLPYWDVHMQVTASWRAVQRWYRWGQKSKRSSLLEYAVDWYWIDTSKEAAHYPDASYFWWSAWHFGYKNSCSQQIKCLATLLKVQSKFRIIMIIFRIVKNID